MCMRTAPLYLCNQGDISLNDNCALPHKNNKWELILSKQQNELKNYIFIKMID